MREGVYDEALVMDKEGLTVKGAGEGVVVENRSEACAATFTAAGTLVGLTLRQHHRHFACVRFEAGAGVLEDCDVTSANLSCVVVAADARPCVRRCKVHGSQQYGVAVKPGARPTLEHNSVFGNCQPNIVIEAGADPLIRYNDIHGSKQNGIWVHTRGKGHIAYNDIYENAYSNVDIMEEVGRRAPGMRRTGYQERLRRRLEEVAPRPPPPPCPTNALSNEHFRSDRNFLGPN